MLANLITIFTLAVTLIFLFILNIIPASTRNRNQYLLVLLICLALHLIAELLMIQNVFGIRVYAVFALSFVVAYGPSIYYYTRKFHGLTTRRFIWHLTPLLVGLWCIFFIARNGILPVPEWILSSYYSGVLLIYFMATLRIRLFHPIKKNNAWMKTIGIGFGVLVLLYVLEAILINFNLSAREIVIRTSTSIYNVFCFIFLLVAIRQIITNPESFSNMKIRIPYSNDVSSDNSTELDIIQSYVIDQEKYKDSGLTRNMIAAETGVSMHQVSEIINSRFKKNFNDWVNDYRIEEAKVFLKESDLSIKEIYYEVGFNSKSAFNYAFKKRTNTTPSQFRSNAAKH